MPVANKSLSLIAALALASHAPCMKNKTKESNNSRRSQSPESIIKEDNLTQNMKREQRLSSNSITSEESDSSLESIIDNSVFYEAVEHVRSSLVDCSDRKQKDQAMMDPKVQKAVRLAKLAMQDPKLMQWARSNSESINEIRQKDVL